MADISRDVLAIREMVEGKEKISIHIKYPNGGGTVVEGRIVDFVSPYVAVEYEDGGATVVNLASPAILFFIVE